MDEQTTSTWYFTLIKGIIMILLAVLVFLSPAGALLTWGFYIGSLFVFAGMVLIYQGFAGRGVHENWTWRVFEGLLDMYIGFMLITNPLITASLLPFLFGFWGAFYGIALFIDGFSHKESNILKLVSAVIIFWISSLIMFNPLLFGVTFAIWIAIIFLVGGVFNLIHAVSIKGQEG